MAALTVLAVADAAGDAAGISTEAEQAALLTWPKAESSRREACRGMRALAHLTPFLGLGRLLAALLLRKLQVLVPQACSLFKAHVCQRCFHRYNLQGKQERGSTFW